MTYFVILELLFIFLPDVSQNFAANLQLSCFLIGNNTLVGGNDCDTKTAQYAGKLFLTSVYTQAGFGDSLDTCDNFFVFVNTTAIIQYTDFWNITKRELIKKTQKSDI